MQVYNAVKRYMVRPAEQLFDTEADPNSINNLINDPELEDIKKRLSQKLNEWLVQQGDPGKVLDTWKVYNACLNGNHDIIKIENPID